MRLVFWQNCLSMHQLPYITKIRLDQRVDSVVIVVPYELDISRKEMGWQVNSSLDLLSCEIIVNPSENDIECLLSERENDSWHLFSGIRGFKFVFDVFKKSLNYSVKRGIITERPNTFFCGNANGKPLWLHKMRFFLQDYKYISSIKVIFAIGDDAVNYYKSLSSKWRVVPFCYVTEICNDDLVEVGGEIRFGFVGSLSWWKAPMNILKAIKNVDCKLYYVGNGPLLDDLKKYAASKKISKVWFYGNVPNVEVIKILNKIDVLVLPSIYDGWGAVVNEALCQGCFVICSDKCGAKDLIEKDFCGMVYRSNRVDELRSCIVKCVSKINSIRTMRFKRRTIMRERLNEKRIAKYMIDVLTCESVSVPWKL